MYIKKTRLVCVVLVTVIITAILTFCYLNPFGVENAFQFYKFSQITKIIDKTYYEEVDMRNAAEMAIAGVAASTGDPYTMYLWGDDATAYMESLGDTYCGVGLYIEVDEEENLISVVSAISGGPAEAVGITTGDKILKIDGEIYSGNQINEASNYMKGEAGTEVVLTIRSAADGSEYDITLVRGEITIDSVTSEMLQDNIGYISISQFTENVSQYFVEAYHKLCDNGAESLIIDLRNNPGGLFDEAVNIAGNFIPNGELVSYTLDKYENRKEFFSEGPNDKKTDMDVVVLMNGGSASASEVLLGALRDHEIATIIGEKSYGKGIVQRAISSGEDLLSVTIARYYAPNGICIHGEGIEPDIMVEMDVKKSARLRYIEHKDDEQLQAAVEFLNKN